MTAEPVSRPRPAVTAVGIAVGAVALGVGAVTGTLPLVLAVVVVVVATRWFRGALHTRTVRRLDVAESQLAPVLLASGYVDVDARFPSPVPDHVLAAALDGRGRQLRRRFAAPKLDAVLEIATLVTTHPVIRVWDRGAVAVAHQLVDPRDTDAAAVLLEACTNLPATVVPPSTRFALVDDWVVAGFDPARTNDPATVAGAVAGALSGIVDDAHGDHRGDAAA